MNEWKLVKPEKELYILDYINNLNNETCYFNGLIKSLDIGISKKSIDKFKIVRDFDLFFCCQVFNFIYYTKKITFKEYFYTIKK